MVFSDKIKFVEDIIEAGGVCMRVKQSFRITCPECPADAICEKGFFMPERFTDEYYLMKIEWFKVWLENFIEKGVTELSTK